MKKNNTPVLIIALLGLASIFYLSIVYKNTFGERDTYRMAMGIIDSITSNKPLGSSMLYGRDISFAYFGLLDFFRPIFKTNLALIIPFMNYINALIAILMVIPFFFLVRRYWGTTIALLANILLLILIPVWRATSQYGHPMTGAILFMFIGLALIGYRSFLRSLRLGWNKLILLDILIVAAFALCLMFRLDAILMFPLIPACLFLEKYPFKKIVSTFILYSVFPIIIFKVMQSKLPEIIGQEKNGILDQLVSWNNPVRYVDNFLRGNLVFIWGLNPLICLIFLISCIYLVYKRSYSNLFFILPTVLLNYIFWLPNAAPARHFIYLSPVVAISIAIFLTDIFPTVKSFVKNNRKTGVALTAILICSVLISYKYSYPVPMSKKYSYTAEQLGNKLQQLEPKNKPIFVIGDTIPAVVKMQLLSKDVKVKYEKTNILTDDDIKAQEKSVFKPKPVYINLIIVENKNNKFICYFQGWKAKVNEIKRFFMETDKYTQGYLVLNMLDKNAKKINVEPSSLTNKLEILNL
ncbi:MAG: hypothetical protein V7K48_22430 [Nostoc sp.]|uniref:hypothetical protein n=1 Tax=Nostoc sp. TaxID=1180 RepID=UPI002FF9745C